MSSEAFEQRTYLPEPADELAELHSFVEAHEARRGPQLNPRCFLAGAAEHDQVEIPKSVHRVLLQVIEAMWAGKAVTIAPHNQVLTTQQAADLLGISRPTVVKLMMGGELPGTTLGKRRRLVRLTMPAYRSRRRAAQYDAIFATSIDLDEEPEAADTLYARLRTVRGEVAAERRPRAESRG